MKYNKLDEIVDDKYLPVIEKMISIQNELVRLHDVEGELIKKISRDIDLITNLLRGWE